jgi:hypothetical protein
MNANGGIRGPQHAIGGLAESARRGPAIWPFAALFSALIVSAPVNAQLLSQTMSPGASFNDVTFGTIAWTTPGNAMASDDAYAQAAPGGGDTNYLHANNFSFNVPPPAEIRGIEVDIERRSALGTVVDSRVRLVKGGVVGTTDMASGTMWPTTDTVATYGNDSELWGETWTAADINASGFGVVLSVTDGADAAFVDHISITVHYALCGDVPAIGCRTADKSLFLVKDKTDDAKDKIVWKWIKGAETSQDDFANPTASATHGFCIYENGAIVGTAVVPPDPSKWTTISTKGYKYKDKPGTEFGVQKMILKGGATGKAKALLKGKGMLLPDPNPDLTLPVVVQLVNGDTGVCWETTFGSALKNVVGLFKAKN